MTVPDTLRTFINFTGVGRRSTAGAILSLSLKKSLTLFFDGNVKRVLALLL